MAETTRPSWDLSEGDEIVSGRHALRRLGGGKRYKAYLAWDEDLLALVVVKVRARGGGPTDPPGAPQDASPPALISP